nr:MurR/RpiR family transcriptional regulator [uncultured Trichococcus sp.]
MLPNTKEVFTIFNSEIIRSFNPTDFKIYECISQNEQLVVYMTIRELSEYAGVSTASILRFCQKCGFAGYKELKYTLKNTLKKQSNVPNNNVSEIIDCIQKFEQPLYKARLEKALDILSEDVQIICIGIGNSGITARYAARRLSSLKKFSLCIDDPYYSVDLPKNNMVALAFSISGEREEVIRIVESFKKSDCPTIVVTVSETSLLSKYADVTLPYYLSYKGLSEVVDTTSQVPATALIEILANMLYERKQKNG